MNKTQYLLQNARISEEGDRHVNNLIKEKKKTTVKNGFLSSLGEPVESIVISTEVGGG